VSATTFNDLTINKLSGTATLSGNITVNSNLNLQAGTFDLNTYTANRSAAGGQLTLAGASAMLVGGANNFPQNFSSSTLAAGSTVTYNGSMAQTVNNISYGNLVLSNGGPNVKTLNGAVTIAGDLTINSGANLDASNYSIALSGNWTNSGTFTPSGS